MKISFETRVARWKEILVIAWPLIVANSFWNLQLTIDRVFLGNYSTEALGAAMAVGGVFWTPMALLQQTASYVMTFVAQYYGAKRFEMIGPAVWHAIYVSVAGGLLVLLFIPFSQELFAVIGHSPTMQKLETEYFVALCYSALPTALVAVASGFYTGLGQTKVIILINLVGVIANALLDYVLIFGNLGFPEMGIYGAGVATALANVVGAVFGLYLVFSQSHEINYNLAKGWRYSQELMKRFLHYGIPSGMQWALEGLAFTIFLVFVGRMAQGDAALASSGIVVTVMMLAVLPPMGVAQAVSVLVGQHLGEKAPERAEISVWSGLQVAAMYIFVIALSFALVPEFYLNWFYNPSNAELWAQVSQMVPKLLLFVALFTIFDSGNLVFSFSLKGAGDTRFVSLMALTLPWPLMVFPTWYVKDWNGAVYWAWGAASTYIILLAFVFWRRFVGGKWKSMSVIN